MGKKERNARELVGVRVYGWPSIVVFPAPVVSKSDLDKIAIQVGAEIVELHTSDQVQLYGWLRRARGERIVLFFHGNAESVADRIPLHDFLVERGWDVLQIAYRGYPGSDGFPSEQGLVEDARCAWNYAVNFLNFSPENIVIHGKSLGGGVAAALSAEVHPAALILESTFLSIPEVAQDRTRFQRAGQILAVHFDTRSLGPKITCPVLILHADQDVTIPISHGRALEKCFSQVRYLEVIGLGHAETLPIVDRQARAAYEGLLSHVANKKGGHRPPF